MSKIIMGIQLQNRFEDSTKLQSLLTKYGGIIQTRIGLHEMESNASGLIVLDFAYRADGEIGKFEKELSAVGRVNIQKMVF